MDEPSAALHATADDVEAQMQRIKAEVEHRPPLGVRDTLDDDCALARTYAHDAVYLRQIRSLYADGGCYRAVRYSRRDGNCFYRCASFRLLELAMQHARVASRCACLVTELRPQMQALYGAYSDDFADAVDEVLTRIAAGDVSSGDGLCDVVNKPDYGYILVFFRYAVSLYIRAHSTDTFLPYIQGLGYDTAEAYCVAEVEPVDHESDNVQVAAFAMLFGVAIHVIALDRNTRDGDVSGADKPTTHVFGASSNGSDAADADEATCAIHLLYTPGHYDLLEV